MKVSFIEIYKEEAKDLLEFEGTSKDLHIREDEKGNTSKFSLLLDAPRKVQAFLKIITVQVLDGF